MKHSTGVADEATPLPLLEHLASAIGHLFGRMAQEDFGAGGQVRLVGLVGWVVSLCNH